MNKAFAQLAILATFCGCPQPTTTDPITSVDGLDGGRITGDLAVDNLTAGAVRSGDVAADTLTVTGSAVFAGSLDADAISTETITVNGAVTASSLSVNAATFIERPTLGGVPLGSEIVGAVARADGPRTAVTAEGSCAEGAHICGEAEFLEALPFFAGVVSSLEGASVNVSSPRSFMRALDGATDRDLVANNCANWTAIADNEGALFREDGGQQIVNGVTAAPSAHGRLVVDQDDSGRVFLGFTVECAASAIRLVCCE